MTHALQFRIAVQRLAQGQPRGEPVSFEAASHDDLIDIMGRVCRIDRFAPAEAHALALGVKLLSGVMLAHRTDPLFATLQPEVRAFIGNLKARVAAASPEARP
jgi:hypothetical protein